MPLYSYRCDNCDATDTMLCSMMEHPSVIFCKCGDVMQRDISADAPRAHGKRYYEKPLHSDSLAIGRSQVAEHKRLFPDIEIDQELRPVFTSYQQHNDYLEKTGFVKLPQKVRLHDSVKLSKLRHSAKK